MTTLCHEYLRSFELCHRHPSRRAVGFCEVCSRHLCRPCAFPDHPCIRDDGEAAVSARRRKAKQVTVATAVLVGLALSVWTLTRPGPAAPAPGEADRAVPRRLSEDRPSGNAPPGEQSAPLPPAGAAATGIGEEFVPLPTEPALLAAATADPEPTGPGPSPVPAVAPGIETPAAARATSGRPVRVPVATTRSFNRGAPGRPALLLSFDAGAIRDGAEEVLDVLAARGVRTTFFITGEFVRANPDLVLRMVGDGHEIGNHTDTHLHLTQWETHRRHTTRPDVTHASFLAELRRTARSFRELTGGDMAPLWRAPYGEYNDEILRWAAEEGWTHVGWTRSLDTLDWVADPGSRIYRSADEIARRLLAYPESDPRGARGAIVLMHLGTQRPPGQRVVRVLPDIVDGYRRRGFEFLTASDMIRGS